MFDSPNAKLGIVASGKSYFDVLALEEFGIDGSRAAELDETRLQFVLQLKLAAAFGSPLPL